MAMIDYPKPTAIRGKNRYYPGAIPGRGERPVKIHASSTKTILYFTDRQLAVDKACEILGTDGIKTPDPVGQSRYSDAIVQEALRLYFDENMPAIDIAHRLNINPRTLSDWINYKTRVRR